ncbi:hypothetical protein PVK06_024887 [Gossypium arboreum]|uniref:Uncharacterized protein n=1 Tax=Gossypium arboreum TaxID=29729 RepID=A0ABR0PF39_GOSAR|nr:hypothetical protein PVK06_024887 [Gossypium arboreum]
MGSHAHMAYLSGTTCLCGRHGPNWHWSCGSHGLAQNLTRQCELPVWPTRPKSIWPVCHTWSTWPLPVNHTPVSRHMAYHIGDHTPLII